MFKKLRPAGLVILFLLLTPLTASAHVKWFADFNFGDRPLTLSEVATPAFFALAMLSTAVIAIFVLLDRRLAHLAWYTQLNDWLMAQWQHSLLVMRIAIAAVLLILWATNNILAPELIASIPGLAWAQFAIAILLLSHAQPHSQVQASSSFLLSRFSSLVCSICSTMSTTWELAFSCW